MNWQGLSSLDLRGTKVTNAGLKEIVKLKDITALYLSSTKRLISDAGLKELAMLKNLSELYVSHTKVTDAGVAELEKALPKCRIHKRNRMPKPRCTDAKLIRLQELRLQPRPRAQR